MGVSFCCSEVECSLVIVILNVDVGVFCDQDCLDYRRLRLLCYGEHKRCAAILVWHYDLVGYLTCVYQFLHQLGIADKDSRHKH